MPKAVVDLFAAAGLEEARLDVLSDDLLMRVAAIEQKDLGVETLRKLLTTRSGRRSAPTSFRASDSAKRSKTR